jgi:hypothetical protein
MRIASRSRSTHAGSNGLVRHSREMGSRKARSAGERKAPGVDEEVMPV